MVNPVKKELVVYLAADGKEFLNEEEAVAYEKALNTLYVLVSYQPDLNETGYFTKTGVIELVGTRGFAKEHAMDVCYSKFGRQVAYVQGYAATKNWEVGKLLSIKEYADLKIKNPNIKVVERWEMPSGSKR